MARTVLVTGVSRRRGIGFAIARRLLREEGARVFAHSYAPYDATEPLGADPDGIDGGMTVLGGEGDRLAHAEADLADPAAPEWLVRTAVDRVGPLDALVVNHARSQLGTLDELAPESLDATWAVNVCAALLLVKAFAAQYRAHPDGGRVVLFTSGQHRGRCHPKSRTRLRRAPWRSSPRLSPTRWSSARSPSTASIPGPTDTGWATPDQDAFVARHMPRGRWNTPDEAADVVALLWRPDAARSPATSSTPKADSADSPP